MFKLTAMATAGLILAAAPALAAITIVNQTEATKTVTIDKGAEEVKHKLAPGASIEEACPGVCGVRFAGHDKMASDGDALAIVDGATRPVRLD